MATISKGAAGFFNVEETVEPVRLRLTGQFPRHISGTLWRTGPGTFDIPTKDGKEFHIQHWFDGLAQHHRFEIIAAQQANGEPVVRYNSRNASRTDEDYIKANGTWDSISFGQQDPCKRLFRRFFQMFSPTTANLNNVQVTLTPQMPGFGFPEARADGQPSRLMAKTDANRLNVIDPETLELLEITNYSKALPELKGPLTAAHSCRDGDQLFNYNLDLGAGGPTYRVFSINESTGKGTVHAMIKDAPGAYLHSLALTQRFVVLAVWEADYAYMGLAIKYNRNLAGAFKHPSKQRKTVFYVIDRQAEKGSGVVARLTAEPFFCFHTINAFDDGDSIVLDLCAWPDHSVCSAFTVVTLRTVEGIQQKIGDPAFHRYRLPISQPKGEATLEYSRAASIELPVCNPAFFHRPYRYCYGVHTTPNARQTGLFVDAIGKFDTQTQEFIIWGGRQAEVPGEPIFVPNVEAREEDDGTLLTVAYDLSRAASSLVAINAKNMQELGRAECPKVVPYGFHGKATVPFAAGPCGRCSNSGTPT